MSTESTGDTLTVIANLEQGGSKGVKKECPRATIRYELTDTPAQFSHHSYYKMNLKRSKFAEYYMELTAIWKSPLRKKHEVVRTVRWRKLAGETQRVSALGRCGGRSIPPLVTCPEKQTLSLSCA